MPMRWKSIVQKMGIGVCLVSLPLSCKEENQPRRHEFSFDIASGNLSKWASISSNPPKTIQYRGQTIPSPWENESVFESTVFPKNSQSDPVGRPVFRPDRTAKIVGTAKYAAVFHPTVMPFKRLTALDTVVLDPAGIPVFTTRTKAQAIPSWKAFSSKSNQLARKDKRPRDRFWGNFEVDLRERRDAAAVLEFTDRNSAPASTDEDVEKNDFEERERRKTFQSVKYESAVKLPMVSPESRILSLRTEPTTNFTLLKDSADNWWMKFNDTKEPTIRVVFLLDAPQSYFGGPLPLTKTNALKHEASTLPLPLQKKAKAILKELGAKPTNPIANTLSILVQYFRAFEESQATVTDSGNIFVDIVKQKIGVCRHRAYAFVILAQALGIPSRFVHSDAHAWAEVKLPEAGWMRIDLGGALEGLEPVGIENRITYSPRLTDPFPWPSASPKSNGQNPLYETAILPSNDNAIALSEVSSKTVKPHQALTELWIDWSKKPERGLRGKKLRLEGHALGIGAIGLSKQTLSATLVSHTNPCLSLNPSEKQKNRRCFKNSQKPFRITLGTFQTNEEGYFKAELLIPTNAPLGTHTLEVQPVSTPNNKY